mgnify:CR=1 FL=1
MKKEKIAMYIVIGIMAMILATIMFAQFKTVEETDITGIETARETELRSMLSSWKTKQEEVEEKLGDTQNRIEDYKMKLESNQESSELIDEELEQTNLLTGQTNVVGEGVIITLTDNEENAIEYNDLLLLVNELRLAGAEAISINDKRILNMTEIVDVGTILINEERVTSPYIVKAIGDQKYLVSALSLKNSGFVDTYQNSGKSVELTKDNNISIPAYNSKKDQMQFKYAKEVEEE